MPPEAETAPAQTIEDRVAEVVRTEMRSTLSEFTGHLLDAFTELAKQVETTSKRHRDDIDALRRDFADLVLRVEKLEQK